MKQTINEYQFIEAFRTMDRASQFSFNGLRALFDYLEQLEGDVGEEIELDVISICCDFCEYEDLGTLIDEYDISADLDKPYTEISDDEVTSWLEERTSIITFDGGIIIQAF
jgi:hypothetical protein